MTKRVGEWLEVTHYEEEEEGHEPRVVTIPSGGRYTVRGPIGDTTIVQIPKDEMHEMAQSGVLKDTMEALQLAVRGGGMEGGLLVVPESLKFMKLRPVKRERAKSLEAIYQRQLAEQRAKLKRAKEEADAEEAAEGNVTELRPDTKTAGSA
jgi:hypothetical protein